MKPRIIVIFLLMLLAVIIQPESTGFENEKEQKLANGATINRNNMLDNELSSIKQAKDEKQTRKRELIYLLTVFDGGSYQNTFCPGEVDMIYMTAGVDNVISTTETEVYYWPPTKEYKADWTGINQQQTGFLEVLKGKNRLKVLPPEKYVIYYPEIITNQAKELIVGEEATAALEGFMSKLKSYREEMAQFRRKVKEYDRLFVEFLQKPNHTNTKHSELPAAPIEPKPPMDFVIGMNEGFILNLESGSYQIRLVDSNLQPIVGSEKRIEVFPVLTRGTGYQIIPEDKWTYPVKSDDLSEGIFSREKQVIYLKPYKEVLYYAYNFTRMLNLNSPSTGRGLENQKTWVHTDCLNEKGYVIEVLKDGEVFERVEDRPYYVRQRSGPQLGYDIIEFNEGEHPGVKPSFIAYKITMPAGTGLYSLRLVDTNGNPLKGSLRFIHLPGRISLPKMIIVSLFPLLIGGIVVGKRHCSKSKYL